MSDKTKEDRLRRQAMKLGYAIRKSRSHNLHADDFGEYMLIDASGNFVVLGSRFNATLDDIESFLKV